MGRTKTTTIEEKCDRCGAIIRNLQFDKESDLGPVEEPKDTTFSVVIFKDGNENHLIQYSMICERCEAVLRNLAEKMSPISFSRGPRLRKGSGVKKESGSKKSKGNGDSGTDKTQSGKSSKGKSEK